MRLEQPAISIPFVFSFASEMKMAEFYSGRVLLFLLFCFVGFV